MTNCNFFLWFIHEVFLIFANLSQIDFRSVTDFLSWRSRLTGYRWQIKSSSNWYGKTSTLSYNVWTFTAHQCPSSIDWSKKVVNSDRRLLLRLTWTTLRQNWKSFLIRLMAMVFMVYRSTSAPTASRPITSIHPILIRSFFQSANDKKNKNSLSNERKVNERKRIEMEKRKSFCNPRRSSLRCWKSKQSRVETEENPLKKQMMNQSKLKRDFLCCLNLKWLLI